MAEAAINPNDFKAEEPAAFYLLEDGRAEMEALADATMPRVVEGPCTAR